MGFIVTYTTMSIFHRRCVALLLGIIASLLGGVEGARWGGRQRVSAKEDSTEQEIELVDARSPEKEISDLVQLVSASRAKIPRDLLERPLAVRIGLVEALTAAAGSCRADSAVPATMARLAQYDQDPAVKLAVSNSVQPWVGAKHRLSWILPKKQLIESCAAAVVRALFLSDAKLRRAVVHGELDVERVEVEVFNLVSGSPDERANEYLRGLGIDRFSIAESLASLFYWRSALRFVCPYTGAQLSLHTPLREILRAQLKHDGKAALEAGEPVRLYAVRLASDYNPRDSAPINVESAEDDNFPSVASWQ